MNHVKQLQDFRQRRCKLMCCDPVQNESMDRLERQLWQNALLQRHTENLDSELEATKTPQSRMKARRTAIFEGFTAQDMQNPVTRESIITALANLTREIQWKNENVVYPTLRTVFQGMGRRLRNKAPARVSYYPTRSTTA